MLCQILKTPTSIIEAVVQQSILMKSGHLISARLIHQIIQTAQIDRSSLTAIKWRTL